MAQDAIVAAQARQAFYADQKKRPEDLSVGDSVIVHREFLLTPEARDRPSHKLQLKWYGLFKVLERVGPNAYRLELPHSVQYHVFNMSALKKYHQNSIAGRVQCPPPPITDLDGHGRFIVDSVLDHRVCRGQLQFLVRWKRNHDAMWEPANYLLDESAEDIIPRQRYKSHVGLHLVLNLIISCSVVTWVPWLWSAPLLQLACGIVSYQLVYLTTTLSTCVPLIVHVDHFRSNHYIKRWFLLWRAGWCSRLTLTPSAPPCSLITFYYLSRLLTWSYYIYILGHGVSWEVLFERTSCLDCYTQRQVPDTSASQSLCCMKCPLHAISRRASYMTSGPSSCCSIQLAFSWSQQTVSSWRRHTSHGAFCSNPTSRLTSPPPGFVNFWQFVAQDEGSNYSLESDFEAPACHHEEDDIFSSTPGSTR